MGKRARIKLRDGETLEVIVNPGYVELRARGEVLHCITIPNRVLWKVLVWLVPRVRKNWVEKRRTSDPVAVMREWEAVDDAQRTSRRERRRSPRRSKKRRG